MSDILQAVNHPTTLKRTVYPKLPTQDEKEDAFMSASAPFLAKFAKPPSKQEAKSNSTSEKGTISTRVARETTDDR